MKQQHLMPFEFELSFKFKFEYHRIKIVLLSLSMEEEWGKQQFAINCACLSFHAYQNLWIPKLKQILQVKKELGNVHDPFAISLWAKIPRKLTDVEVKESQLIRQIKLTDVVVN